MKKLRGVNLGSWLLMEGYILGGRNIPEHEFKDRFIQAHRQEEFCEFQTKFRSNFITDKDIKRLADWGANCLRIPFNYRLLEKKPYKYEEEGIEILKNVVNTAGKYGLGVILDLHAACGAQNCDWHSDSNGKAMLWQDEDFRERTFSLWEYLADCFKGNPYIEGFDLLNEPVLDSSNIGILKEFYSKLIKKIHAIDKERLLYLKGNRWGQEIEFLQDLLDDNIAVSIHTYGPLDFTYNFRREYRYPGVIWGQEWNKAKLKDSLKKYKEFSQRNNDVEIFVGEFGINYRGGFYGELDFLRDILDIYKEWGFSWTYWTYKAVANSVFPDGIMQYLENPLWVRREGPVYGWENYILFWKEHKQDILDFFKTDNFVQNNDIVNILKEYF